MQMKFRFLGIEFSDIYSLIDQIQPGDFQSTVFHFAAVSTVVAAHEDPNFLKIINSGVVFCDSKPLAVLLRYKHKVDIQMRGIDFLRREFLDPKFGPSYFIIGSSADVLQHASVQIKSANQKCEIIGVLAPTFSNSISVLENQVVKSIGDFSPDCILICIGSPKQDLLAHQLRNRYKSRIVTVGAALDFYSGLLNEASLIYQKTGTEWLYRLFSEPRRLWRRYLIGNVKFIFIVLKHWFAKSDDF